MTKTQNLMRVAVFIASAAPTGSAQAQSVTTPPDKPAARCVHFHMEAQRQRRDKQLVEAKQSLGKCSMAECPAVVQQDCLEWIQAIDEQTPSIVFSVQGEGSSLGDAQVTVDGSDVDTSRGAAVPLNPGQHSYAVKRPPFEDLHGSLAVLEGQRYRVVNLQMKRAAVRPAVVATQRRTALFRPIPTATWVLLGAGVAGAGAFAGMGLAGRSQQRELEKACSPTCTDQDLSSTKSLYLGADIAAGVGIAALVAAGVVFATRPTEEREVALSFSALPGGAYGAVRWRSF